MVMVRILILKYLYNLSDEQMEYQLLDRMSYQRFCLLPSVSTEIRPTWHSTNTKQMEMPMQAMTLIASLYAV